jgi:uncharacterized protein with PQ loop repeat
MNIGDHHLNLRKRMYRDLEPYPHPKQFQRRYDRTMYLVGTLAPLALIPQVIKLFVYHQAAGFVLITWVLLSCINLLWIGYATLHREYPILIANCGMGLLNIAMVVGILIYR